MYAPSHLLAKRGCLRGGRGLCRPLLLHMSLPKTERMNEEGMNEERKLAATHRKDEASLGMEGITPLMPACVSSWHIIFSPALLWPRPRYPVKRTSLTWLATAYR